MKHDRSDIRLLLGILLLVSLSIGMIYASSNVPVQQPTNQMQAPQSSTQSTQQIQASQTQAQEVQLAPMPTPPQEIPVQIPPEEHPFARLSPVQAAEQLEVYEYAHDVEKMAQTLQGLDVEKIKAIAKEVIEDKTSPLTRDEMLEFLYALVMQEPDNESARHLILDLIFELAALHPGPALLLVAARSEYPAIIPFLLTWVPEIIKRKGEPQTPRPIALLVQEALEQVIQANEPESLEKILFHKTPMAKNIASRLLWVVVEGNKNPALVKLLVDHGADINYHNKGYSLIAKAVEQKNFPMVKALVEAGGAKLKINALHEPSVGTALQIAIEKGLAPFDEYLREHGASEDLPLKSIESKSKKKKLKRGKN